jgi:aryl-alcohol dehydrogenase-like predicted oxidoreductase
VPRFEAENLAANQVLIDHVRALADQRGATPAQVALAWLLRRSPVMLPIPGTSTVAHLEENMQAVA